MNIAFNQASKISIPNNIIAFPIVNISYINPVFMN